MMKKRKLGGGRPTLTGEVGGGESMRVSVRLTDTHITTAKLLGDGRLSEGVRTALELAKATVGAKAAGRERETQLKGTYYEFFAGGGMARAGLGSGWTCLLANDICEKKAAAYAENWGKDHLKVSDVYKLTVADLPSQADMVWASFPCQDLSLAGNYAGLKGERSGAFWGFWKLIKALAKEHRKPSVIALENVFGALTSHGGKDFEAIAKALVSEGYAFGAVVVDGVHFVPQSRPRLFIVAFDADIPVSTGVLADGPTAKWHPAAIMRAYAGLPRKSKDAWRWFSMPEPRQRMKTLADLIEQAPTGIQWHSEAETERLLGMMSLINRQKVIAAQASRRLSVGTIYRRTREGVQRAEIRFDGISGCLRTPGGGSSRQTIMIVDGPSIRSRLLSPREAARLMGLPDTYKLPVRYNDAYMLAGDGLVVPAVRHVARHVIEPILDARRALKKAA